MGALGETGLFRRLKANVRFLIEVLRSGDRSTEHKSFARAAVSYFVCEDDAIDDRLGIVGYLDDNFIAQLAVDSIEPAREPWSQLLDAVVGVRPFLTAIVLDDSGESLPLSEFAVINTALTCPELRSNLAGYTTLVLPDNGPMPFLLGFVAALSQIHQSLTESVREDSFYEGQKVLVDNSAVAEFAGFAEVNGRRMFKLKQTRKSGKVSTSCIRYWPISELHRLLPASKSRAIKGKLTYNLAKNESPLPALEYLFNASVAGQVSGVEKRTILVAPIASTRETAKRIHLLGHPLCDVVPMGSLANNEIKSWTTNFGKQAPLLVVVADLDEAAAYVEDNVDSIAQIVVDATGRNAQKPASLLELHRYAVQSLIVTPERSASALANSDVGSSEFWEWTPDDYRTLLWPKSGKRNRIGAIGRFEQRLQRQSDARPHVEILPLQSITDAFDAVKRLQSLSRKRGEDRLADLDDLLAVSFNLLFRLIRSASPPNASVGANSACDVQLSKLREVETTSAYLTAEERSATTACVDVFQAIIDAFGRENPKHNSIANLLRQRRRQSLICPEINAAQELEHAFPNVDVRVLSGVDTNGLIDAGIIPGWYGKDRMERLLVPPVANPLTLILYEIEARWYDALFNARATSRQLRAGRSDRSVMFPTINGWKKRKRILSTISDSNANTSLRDLDAIQEDVRKTYRDRAERAARSDGHEREVDARLVLFEGNTFAFITDTYEASVVTHLLETDASEDDDIDVERKAVKQLRTGDALLFHRRSGRDVIRLMADEFLPKGTRETALIWQETLRNYVHQNHLSIKTLHRRLRKAGCKVVEQTVRGWVEDDDRIAPKKYKEFLPKFAELTADRNLANRIGDVLKAIPVVFGAHQSASRRIARDVVRRTVSLLQEESSHSAALVELESDVVIVRVMEISEGASKVRASIANRLQEPIE
ncbi:MAG: DrmE family protein [Pirellulaceae bacterium]